jgi:hypothetical protein
MSESTALAVRLQTGLVPQSVDQATQLAKIMAENSLVPAHLKGKVADCFLVVDVAIRWGMSPFAVAQCTSVISGKMMFEGKLVAAVINAKGDLARRLDYRFEGEGDKLVCYPFATLRGEDEPRTIPEGVALAKVRTSNDQWRKQPHQQLTYAAARIWARRHMPELMLGVYSEEEDIDDAPPDPGHGRGSGPNGRIVKADVDAHFEAGKTGPKAAPSASPSTPATAGGNADPKAPTAPSASSSAEPAAGVTADADGVVTDPDDPKPGEFRDQVECWTWKVISGTVKAGNMVGEWVSTGMHPQRSAAQNAKFHALCAELGVTEEQRKERVLTAYNKTSSADLSVDEMREIIDKLEDRKRRFGTKADKDAKQARRAAEAQATIDDYIQGPRSPGQEG